MHVDRRAMLGTGNGTRTRDPLIAISIVPAVRQRA
jgi:hypothetical protein